MLATSSARRSALVLCYGGGALQGLAMVTLPASATVLQHELGVSSATYGALFLAQTIAAIVGALAAGAIARRGRGSLSALLAFALASHAIALVALVAATRIDPALASFVAATALGLGFGVGAIPLNAVPVALGRGASATTTMHAMIGGGFALGPAIVGLAIAEQQWVLVPLVLAIATVIVAAAIVRTELPSPPAPVRAAPVRRRALVGLAAVAIAYAFAEGTFSSWTTVFLHDARGISAATAANALSGFWAALAFGRLCSAPLLARIGPLATWKLALGAMASVMLTIPLVDGPIAGVLAFIAAGLATSVVFPLTVALAIGRLGLASELAAALATAALMIGVGVGSFAIGALREAIGFDALYRMGAVYPLLALALGGWLFARASTPRNTP